MKPNTAAYDAILKAIKAKGRPLNFAEFTELSLFGPGYGYYSRARVRIKDKGGDFVTSPEASPLFGNATARAIRDYWEDLGRPKEFTIVEMGAGNGTWARDILDAIQREHPEALQAALTYIIVESSPGLKALQRKTLHGRHVHWHGTSAFDTGLTTGSITGAVISNELPDCFPAHRIIRRGDTIREIYIDVNHDGQLLEIERSISPDIDLMYYQDVLIEGIEMAYQPRLPDWVKEVSRILARGFVLTIDYGGTADQLAIHGENLAAYGVFEGGPRTGDHHIRNAIKYPGCVDITAKANFSDIMRFGSDAQLITLDYLYQKDFLFNHGLALDMELLRGSPERTAAERLIDVQEFGMFKVLVQRKQTGTD
ncbi:MAG TPA: SAM-dependent methyltransferase [Bacillota bacterium]|nr:SAM-dependent methyltransferase [Bacillota bacterium]